MIPPSPRLIPFYGSSYMLEFLEAFKSWHFSLICTHSVQRAHEGAQRNFEMWMLILRTLLDRLELSLEK